MSLEEDILIERFLRNQLSEKERNDFLDTIANDQNFKEKFLLEKQIFETLNEEEWSYVSKIDVTEVEEYTTLYRNNADRLKQVIHKATTSNKRKNKIRRLTYFSAVAAVALFALLINFYLQKNQKTIEEIYTNYSTYELPSLVTRNPNEVDPDLALAENNFKNENYQEAIIYIDKLLKKDKDNSTLYVYKAISHWELGDYSSAEESLDTLINSDLIDSEKGYWYKSLLYLKTKDLDKCKKILQVIIKNSYSKNKEAKELFEEIVNYKT
ncbi:tetratricopeptide repeat protein [Aquimarina latercula]|uniref:tetratricopeptide repeat protein n=1 Tax=Aquimarina latercula TaxID=987 RepID=UPI0003FE7D97|nr:tetratricopeptide repeat protein [Aquimarina latercula]